MAYTVYTVGDLQILRQALTGVAMMFDPGNNTILNSNAGAHLGSAAGMGALITLTIILVKGLYNQAIRLEELLICVVMYAALFVPKITVTLEDVYNGTTTVVSNVPVGVAMPAVLMSGVVHSLTQKMDVAFSTTNGNYVGLTEEGFVSPLKLFIQLRNGPKKDVSQEFAGSMMEYFRYCVKDSSGGVKADESLMKSDNLSNYLANNNVNAMTYFYTSSAILASPASGATPAIPALPVAKYPGAGLLVSCSQAGYLLSDYMVKWASNNLGAGNTSSDKSIRWAVGNSNKAAVSNSALFGSSLQSLVGTGSYNADAVLINIAFSNLILDMRSRGGIADPDMAISSFTMTEAMERWKADQVGSGEIFQKTMNQSMSVFLFLFFAMAPIVGVVTAIMGMAGIKLLLSYFMFGIWTQSWLPVAAVINFYIQSTVETELGRLLAPINFGALSANMNGSGYTVQELFSPALIDSTYNLLTQKLAMASSMMSLVPTITAAILGGGMFALTSLAGKMGGQGGYFDEKKISGNDIVKTTGAQAKLDYAYKNHGLDQNSWKNGSLISPDMRDVADSGNYSGSMALGTAVNHGATLQKTAERAQQIARTRLSQAVANFTDGGSNVIAGGTSQETQGQSAHLLQLADQFQQDHGLTVDRGRSKQIIAQATLAGKTNALVTAMEAMRRGDFEAGASVAKGIFSEVLSRLGINVSQTEADSSSSKTSDGSKQGKSNTFGKNINWQLAEKAARRIEDAVKHDGNLQQAYQNSLQAQNLVKDGEALNLGFSKSANLGQSAGANYSRNVAEFWSDIADDRRYNQGAAVSSMLGTVSRVANNPHGKGGPMTQEFAQDFKQQLLKAGNDWGAIRNLIHGAMNSTDAGERSVGFAALGAFMRGTGSDGLVQLGRFFEQASEDHLTLKNQQLKANALMQDLNKDVPATLVAGNETLNNDKHRIEGEAKSRIGEAESRSGLPAYYASSDNIIAANKGEQWNAFQGEWKQMLDRQIDLVNGAIGVSNGQTMLGLGRDIGAMVASSDTKLRILGHSIKAFGYAEEARKGDSGAWVLMQEEMNKARALTKDRNYQNLPVEIRDANKQMDETVIAFIKAHGGEFSNRTPDPTQPDPVSPNVPLRPGEVKGRIH